MVNRKGLIKQLPCLFGFGKSWNLGNVKTGSSGHDSDV